MEFKCLMECSNAGDAKRLLALLKPALPNASLCTTSIAELAFQLSSALLFSFPIGLTAGSSLAVCLLFAPSFGGVVAIAAPGLGDVPVGGGGEPIDEGW
jgi:hypothetical protein